MVYGLINDEFECYNLKGQREQRLVHFSITKIM